MSNSFYTTTTVRRPFQDFAPHLETGTKLSYGVKIYRGYADVQNQLTFYQLIDAETGQYMAFDTNSAIIGMSIKASPGTLDGTFTFRIYGISPPPVGAISQFAGSMTTANVNLGEGCTYYDIVAGTTNSSIRAISSTNPPVLPYIYTSGGANSSVANRVYVTFLVMKITP